MNILSPQEVDTIYRQSPKPVDWTVVIPAAGRGSRLGFAQPKILYPIAGRPILDWLIDILDPACGQFVFVLSPTGQTTVTPHLKKRLKGKFTVAIQEEPRGMADAIYQAVPDLATPHTLIIWGDQVAIRPETITRVQKIHQYSPATKLSLPIVSRPNPYVHYETDSSHRFIRVLERREGAAMPDVGQSDCGLFALDTPELQKIFQSEIDRGITYSQGTKEWNFLPFLPQFESGGESVRGLGLESLAETVGVNDAADVALLEEYFKTLGR